MTDFRRRKLVRREEVARIRAEGADAYNKRKHRQSCPYKDMNRYQWLQGYKSARFAKEGELYD